MKALAAKTVAKFLYLPSQSLTEVPQEIGPLRALKLLDLRDNQLTVLPKHLVRLSKLEELYLDKNLIHDIPDDFSDLKALTCCPWPTINFNSFRWRFAKSED